MEKKINICIDLDNKKISADTTKIEMDKCALLTMITQLGKLLLACINTYEESFGKTDAIKILKTNISIYLEK